MRPTCNIGRNRRWRRCFCCGGRERAVSGWHLAFSEYCCWRKCQGHNEELATRSSSAETSVPVPLASPTAFASRFLRRRRATRASWIAPSRTARENTLVLSRRSICSRAAVPIFFSVAPCLPIRMAFCPSRSHVDSGGDARQLLAFFVLIDQHRGRVRHFLRGVQQHLLADQLRYQEPLRLVGDLVFGEVSRAFGQGLDYAIQQRVEPLALQRRDRDHFGEVVQFFVLRDQRQQLLLVDGVDLVQQQKARAARSSSPCRARTGRRSRTWRSHPRSAAAGRSPPARRRLLSSCAGSAS